MWSCAEGNVAARQAFHQLRHLPSPFPTEQQQQTPSTFNPLYVKGMHTRVQVSGEAGGAAPSSPVELELDITIWVFLTKEAFLCRHHPYTTSFFAVFFHSV